MSLAPLLYIFTLHFIGDFVLQSNWMARNKSKSFIALSAHVLTYTLTLWIGLFILSIPFLFSLMNGVAHLGVDYHTSKVNSQLYQEEDKYWFFVGVGFDQLLHICTLTVIYYIVMSKV